MTSICVTSHPIKITRKGDKLLAIQMCAKLTELGNSKIYFITYKKKEKGKEQYS